MEVRRLGLFQELEAFAKVLDSPVKPVCAILGGAKARVARGLVTSLSCSGTGGESVQGDGQDSTHQEHAGQGAA